MPSRDDTGKPLSGAAKRRRAAAARSHLALVEDGPPPAAAAGPPLAPPREPMVLGSGSLAVGAPAPFEVPPIPGTVEAAIVWAAAVQARIARMARQGLDPERVRAASGVVGAMGKLRSYAKDSEDAVIVLRVYLRQEVDVRGEEPPRDAAGLCAWAFWQLAELLAETATAEVVDESAVSHRARALAQLNHVRPQARLDEVEAARLKAQEEA